MFTQLKQGLLTTWCFRRVGIWNYLTLGQLHGLLLVALMLKNNGVNELLPWCRCYRRHCRLLVSKFGVMISLVLTRFDRRLTI